MRSMVIDDEFVALTKLTTILSEYGPCDAATHGMQALEMHVQAVKKGEPYDLITFDLDMPGISGLEALRRICHLEVSKRIPAARKFVITGESSLDNLRACQKNADAFLVKPIKRKVLISKLVETGLISEGSPAAGAAAQPTGA